MLALVLALLITLTHAEKEAWGMAQCEMIAEENGYHECAVEIDSGEERMWLHYGCARWDPAIENWRINFDMIVPYRWIDIGPKQLEHPVMVGCPEYF